MPRSPGLAFVCFYQYVYLLSPVEHELIAKYHVQLLLNPTSQRNSAIDGFQAIPFLVRRYKIIERLRRPNEARLATQLKDIEALVEDLETKIMQLYRCIFEYQIRLMRQSSHCWPLRFGRDVVKADDWATMLIKIKDLDSECSAIARALGQEELESGIKESNARIDDLVRTWNAGLEELQKDVKDTSRAVIAHMEGEQVRRLREEARRCLHILRTKNPYEDQKNRTPSRLPGTCNWFLNNKQFQTWREEPCSSFLWVSANPGCGKSVLSKSLVEEKLVTLNPQHASICYFFFKDTSPDSRSSTKALSAILHQLFSQKPVLADHALAAYASNGKELPDLFGELWNILVHAVTDPEAGEVICVLDAVDECEETQLGTLIDAVKNFFGNSDKERLNESRFRFLMTSRPYRKIHLRFDSLKRKVPTIHLSGDAESDLIRKEIDVVIRSEVSAIALERSLAHESEAFLLEQLLTMRNRTYLWLHLILDQIRNSDRAGNAEQLRKEIESLPQSVTQAYEAILGKTKDREMATRLLHIVVGAERPLSVQEVNIAMSMEEHYTTYEDLKLDCSEIFEARIKNICGLFIYVDQSEVYLIHQTARDFLLARSDAPKGPTEVWEHSLRPEESNSVLAKICVSFLMLKEFQQHSVTLEEFVKSDPEARAAITRYSEDFCFISYAAQNWATHLRQATEHQQTLMLDKAIKLCDTRSPRATTWVHLFYDFEEAAHYRGSWRTTDLLLATSIGCKPLIQHLLSQGIDINAEDYQGATALDRAVGENEYLDIIQLLLENGAHVEGGDWIIPWNEEVDDDGEVYTSRSFFGRPLYMAVLHSNFEVMRILLRYGANLHALGVPNPADGMSNDSPFQIAFSDLGGLFEDDGSTEDDRIELMSTLFEYADINAVSDTKWQLSDCGMSVRQGTPLLLAVQNRDVAIARFLIERGADINVRVLLEDDDDDDSEKIDYDDDEPDDGEFMDRLHISRERLRYLKRKLRADALKSKQDLRRCVGEISSVRLIHVTAALDKDNEMLQLLLRHGASPHADAPGEPTPLHLAALSGNEEAVIRLLEYGADIEAQDGHGETVLIGAIARDNQWSVDGGQQGMVQRLLERGASPHTAQAQDGALPLHYAVAASNETVIQMLFDRGAVVDAGDFDGKTALVYAVDRDDYSVVYLLLGRGANPNISDGTDAKTPLHRAAAKGYDPIVDELLEHGAEDMEARDRFGNSPLAWALENDRHNVAESLLSKGAIRPSKKLRGEGLLENGLESSGSSDATP